MPRSLLSRCLLVVLLATPALVVAGCSEEEPVDRFDTAAHTTEAFTEHFLERRAPQLCTFTGRVRQGKVVRYQHGGAAWRECLDMWARSFDLYEPSEEPTIRHTGKRFATAHWPGFRIDLARAGGSWLVTGILSEPETATG